MNGAQRVTVGISDLRRYLLRHGWSRMDHPNKRLELFRTAADSTGDYSSLALPANSDFRDAGSLIQEALGLVSAHEGVSVEKALDSVQQWDRDVL